MRNILDSIWKTNETEWKIHITKKLIVIITFCWYRKSSNSDSIWKYIGLMLDRSSLFICHAKVHRWSRWNSTKNNSMKIRRKESFCCICRHRMMTHKIIIIKEDEKYYGIFLECDFCIRFSQTISEQWIVVFVWQFVWDVTMYFVYVKCRAWTRLIFYPSLNFQCDASNERLQP